MSRRRTWREIRAETINTPEREKTAELEKARLEFAHIAASNLAHVRRQRGETQTHVAAALAYTPANVSRIEHEADLKLSTLAGYAEALGGRADIAVRFPDAVHFLDGSREYTVWVGLTDEEAEPIGRAAQPPKYNPFDLAVVSPAGSQPREQPALGIRVREDSVEAAVAAGRTMYAMLRHDAGLPGIGEPDMEITVGE